MKTLISFIGRKSLLPVCFSIIVGFGLACLEIVLASYFVYLLSLINLSQVHNNLINNFLNSIDNPYLILLGFVALSGLRSILHVAKGYLAVGANELFVTRLRFICINSVVLDSSVKLGSSKIYSLISDVFLKSALTFYGIAHSIPLVVQCCVLFVFLVITSLYLSSIGTIAFILTGFIVLIIQRKIASVVLPIKNINDNLYQNLKRVIENVILIRLFNIEKIEIEKTRVLLADYLERIKKGTLFSLVSENLPQFFGAIVISILFSIQITSDEISAEVFIGFVYIFVRLIQSLSQVFSFLSNSIINFPYFKAALSFYVSISEDEVREMDKAFEKISLNGIHSVESDRKANNNTNFVDAPTIEIFEVNHEFVKLMHGAKKITLSVQNGQRCVIVGPSGSGKSSILSMVAGILEPKNGKIEISGISPPDYIKSFANYVSYAGPEPLLFEGTLRENLLYGATISVSDEEIIRVLEDLNLGSWLQEFGYDLSLMLGGSELATSTGQAQRLSLARAILRKPKLLLLDEVTANLDVDTEQNFIALLDKMKGKTTVVIVTHSNAMQSNADVTLDLNAC